MRQLLLFQVVENRPFIELPICRLGQMRSPVNTSCEFSLRFNSLAVFAPPGHLPFQEASATFFTTIQRAVEPKACQSRFPGQLLSGKQAEKSLGGRIVLAWRRGRKISDQLAPIDDGAVRAC
jgi:hypothetical protein